MNAFLHSLIGTAAMAVALIAPAAAQWKPTKPVHLVVPLAPGSNLDNQARLLAKGMSDALGVPVVVDNKPGGGTLIAARQVMTASPDGYTLLYNVAVMTTMPHLYKKAPFDLFKDFTPITAGSLGGTVLVTRTDSPFKDLASVVSYAKANPGKAMIASYGIGTPSHLNIEMMKRLVGAEIEHIPYAGGSTPANIDLLGGRIDLYFDGPATAIRNLQAGKIRILGAATEKRIPAIPDVRTFREQGLDMGIDGWLAFFGPGGLPRDVVDTLYKAIVKAMEAPEFRRVVVEAGLDFGGETPEVFSERVRRDYQRWGKVIADAGIKLD